ncbi:MAG: hypothetical protein K2G13_07350, partial [Muribaculaceae bacterium]|nr:hypothetical protein [Muribaculaceae bacterium]
VCERYGIERTSQVVDLLALMGDKIDNIPGCPGVGEKTAQKLIADFGTAEDTIARSSEIKGALRKKIEDNAALIMLSKDLATIRTDVPIDATPESLAVGEVDKDRLFAIFKDLEFKSLIDRVGRRILSEKSIVNPSLASNVKKSAPAQPSLFDFDVEDAEIVTKEVGHITEGSLGKDCVNIEVENQLSEMSQAVSQAGVVGVHMVTVGENDMDAVWRGTAMAIPDGRSWYVDAALEGGKDVVLDIFADSSVIKVMAASKRDMVIARRSHDDPESNPVCIDGFFDVTIAHYLLEPEMRHIPEILAEKYLDYTLNPGSVPAELAALYLRLKEIFEPALAAEGLDSLMSDIELPLVPVLADMEYTGVRIDTKALADAAEGMEDRSRKLCEEIYEIAGEEFNVGSPA